MGQWGLQRIILDGLMDGSLLGIRRQAEGERLVCRYVMIARHSGSIDGWPKAEPHTWTSSIAIAAMRLLKEMTCAANSWIPKWGGSVLFEMRMLYQDEPAGGGVVVSLIEIPSGCTLCRSIG